MIRFTTALLILATLPTLAWAQGRSIPKGSEAKAQEEAVKVVDTVLPEGQKYRYPLLNGLNVSIDVFDPVMRQLNMLSHCSYEAQAMLDIHHRYFPLAAIGWGSAEEKSNNGLEFGTDTKQEVLFKSDKSFFGKVGMAYNLNYNDVKPDDLYLLFARYGLAWNSADISNLYYANDRWGALGPLELNDQEYTTHWLELGGTLKVQVWQRIALGWDIYWKVKLYQSGTSHGQAFYVPGLGTNDSPVGFSFRIFYDIF